MVMTKTPTISAAEFNDIRIALHYAISDRESFVGSYAGVGDDPAVKRARNQVTRYKKLLKKYFDDMTDDDRDKADALSGKTKNISIFDIPIDDTF